MNATRCDAAPAGTLSKSTLMPGEVLRSCDVRRAARRSCGRARPGLASIAASFAVSQSVVAVLKLLTSGTMRRPGRVAWTNASTSCCRDGVSSVEPCRRSSPRCSHSGTSVSMRPMFSLRDVKLVSSQFTKKAMSSVGWAGGAGSRRGGRGGPPRSPRSAPGACRGSRFSAARTGRSGRGGTRWCACGQPRGRREAEGRQGRVHQHHRDERQQQEGRGARQPEAQPAHPAPAALVGVVEDGFARPVVRSCQEEICHESSHDAAVCVVELGAMGVWGDAIRAVLANAG